MEQRDFETRLKPRRLQVGIARRQQREVAAVVNEYGEGKEAEAVDAWLEENGDQFDWVVSE